MDDTEKLIQEFLERGGTIRKVPSRIFNRKDYEEQITQNTDGLDILIDQAEQLDDEED